MGAPQTLPADFNGWDKPPATLPANFDKWDDAGKQDQSFLQRMATQPSQFSTLNPLRYFDEIGQGMAQGAEALAHPIDTAGKMWEHFKNPVPPGEENKGVPISQVADTIAQGWGQAATVAPVVKGAMAAAPVVSDLVSSETAAKLGNTAKTVAQTAAKVGDVASFERFSKGYNALRQGASQLADIWRKPDATLDNITDQLAQTIADDRARRLEMQSKGLGELPATGAKPAAQTGEALANGPTSSGPEPPKGNQGAPRFTQNDRAAARTLLQDVLKNSSSDIVDRVIPPKSNYGANLATKARVDFSLSRGDVAGAEAALDAGAKQANPNWVPLERQIVPSTNEIRARLQARPSPTRADELDTHALQQEMSYDLQRHGWSAEEEARREFIARNSNGFVKTQSREFGGPSLLSNQLPGEATPKIGRGAKAPAPASDDLTDILQKSLDEARKRRQQK